MSTPSIVRFKFNLIKRLQYRYSFSSFKMCMYRANSNHSKKNKVSRAAGNISFCCNDSEKIKICYVAFELYGVSYKILIV